MTTTETPRDADGNPLCAWCGGPIQQPATGRRRAYCKPGHREMAYRDRREQRLIAKAYTKGKSDAEAWSVSSTGGTPGHPVSPVDETRSPGQTPARGAEPCPYCRGLVTGLVAHLRECPERPGTDMPADPPRRDPHG